MNDDALVYKHEAYQHEKTTSGRERLQSFYLQVRELEGDKELLRIFGTYEHQFVVSPIPLYIQDNFSFVPGRLPDGQ